MSHWDPWAEIGSETCLSTKGLSNTGEHTTISYGQHFQASQRWQRTIQDHDFWLFSHNFLWLYKRERTSTESSPLDLSWQAGGSIWAATKNGCNKIYNVFTNHNSFPSHILIWRPSPDTSCPLNFASNFS